MKVIINLCVVWGVLFTTILHAQQNVTYGNKTLEPSQVLKTSIGNRGETFSFYISEHDMSPNGPWAKEVKRLQSLGKQVDPNDAPKGLSLHLSVYLKNGIPFPIKPEDSIVVSLSNIKKQRAENDYNEMQISKIDKQKSQKEGESLKASIEQEMKVLLKQMQEGKITPDEFANKLEALSKPVLNEIDNLEIMNHQIEEQEDQSYYDIVFFDTVDNIEANVLEGNLHIVEFNKNKLVAYIKGKHIVECTDVTRMNSPSRICKQVDSQLYPGLQVLKEGNVYLSIDSNFKEFQDNR
ncbi:MAG: hypothetical protein WBG46_07715 [Nonlabens sp.]